MLHRFEIKTKVIAGLFFAFVFLVSTLSTVNAASFTRKPFLQNVTTSSAEIRWVTDTHEQLVVKYGTSTSYGSQVNSDTVSGTGGPHNHARVSGLSANTKYFYQITSGSGAALTPAGDSNYYFTTAPATGSGTAFKFAVWGDSGNASTRQHNVARQVFGKAPNLAFVVGDIVYDYGTNFATNNQKHFDIYTKPGQNSMAFAPYYVLCGNHEDSCPTVVADHSLPGGGAMGGPLTTYSFDYGNVHFVSLNSNGSFAYNASNPSASDPQIRWAFNDLRNSNQPWKVVLFHHNGWSAGSHSTNSAVDQNLVKMAADAGADVVFWGHSHVYERWNRRSGFNPSLQQFTIGNGGQAKAGGSTCTSTAPGPGCAGKSTGEAGFLLAEVNGDSMTVRYITETGANADSVTLTSNGSGPTGGATNPPTATRVPTQAGPTATRAPTSGQATPTAIPNRASLSLLPATQTLATNRNASLTVPMNPNGNNVSSVELVIRYNPQLVRVDSITPGPFFTDPNIGTPIEIKQINNTTGVIDYAVGFPLGSGFSSNLAKSVATINYTTLAPGTNQFTWTTTGTPATMVASGTGSTVQNVLGSTFPASVAITSSGATLTPTRVPTVTRAPSGGPSNTPIPGRAILSVSPPSQTVSANSNGTFNVNLNPQNNNVGSMEFVINFNPSIMRVNSVAPGAFFTDPGVGTPVEIIESIDNNAGRIHYSVGFPLGSNFGSTAVKPAATISFTALNSGTSAINFVTSGTPSTIVANTQGSNVLGTTNNGSLTVSGGTATSTPTRTPTSGPTTTPIPNRASLSISPSSQTVSLNSTNGNSGNFAVSVNPQGNSVSSMEIVLNYNPSIIRVNNITPGVFFTDPGVGSPIEIVKTIDQNAGRIHYAVGFPLGSNFGSTAVKVAANINFTALAGGTSQISFITSGSPSTQVANVVGQNILGSTFPGSVTVSGGNTPTLTSVPTFVPTSGPTSTSIPTITPIPGRATLTWSPSSQTVAQDANGNVSININPQGNNVSSVELVINYDPTVVRFNSITPGAFFTDPGVGSPIEIVKTIDQNAGRIHYAVGFPLGSGASSSAVKAVANLNFTGLAAGSSLQSFIVTGSPSTQVANLNGENVIGSTLTGLITVSGSGENTPTVTRAPSATRAPSVTGVPNRASLAILPSNQQLGTNSSGSLELTLNPQGNNVSSLEAVITFDPTIVRVDDITPGAFFTDPGVGEPIEVIKNISNGQGVIHYAVGFPLGSNFGSTATNVAANISFTTLGASGTSPFNFVTSGPLSTQVANLSGVNVLGETQNALVSVGGGLSVTPTKKPLFTLTPGVTKKPTPTAIPGGGVCVQSSKNWKSMPFDPQAGKFTAEFDATPTAEAGSNGTRINAVAGLSTTRGTSSYFTDLAAIVLFSQNGNIEARNSTKYSSTNSVPYVMGQTYHIRMVVDVTTRTYSVYVTPPGGPEKQIANNFKFRTERRWARYLDRFAIRDLSIGSLKVCDFKITVTQSVPLSITPMPGNGGNNTDVDWDDEYDDSPKPVVTFTADSTNIASGTSTTLRWIAEDAVFCNGFEGTNGWAGSRGITGTFETGNLTSTRRFGIVCGSEPNDESDREFNDDDDDETVRFVTINVGPAGAQNTPTPFPTNPVPTNPVNPGCQANNGDADGNGTVDLNDFNIWLAHYNQPTTEGPSEGDFNCSGLVDGIDYVIWLDSYVIAN